MVPLSGRRFPPQHPTGSFLLQRAWRIGLVMGALGLAGVSLSAEERPPQPSSTSVPAAGTPSIRFVVPVNGQAVHGTVRLTFEVSPQEDIDQVMVYRDDALLGIDLEPPYDLLWETQRETDGPHALFAKALDTEFRQGVSSRLIVSVDNAPPTVTWVAPAEGSLLAGTVRLTAQATDQVGVHVVRFLANAKVVGEVSALPYVFEWNTKTAPNVQYTLEGKALDQAGNGGGSKTVDVRVANYNEHPILATIGPKSVVEGSPLVFTIEARDPDGERDPLVYEAFRVPPWANFAPQKREFRGTPEFSVVSMDDVKKEYRGVRFQVCDPEPLCDSEEITITVLDRNDPPVLQRIGDQTLNEKQPLALTLVASDPNGDPLTCTIEGLPAWASFDASRCVATGVPGPEIATLAEPKRVYSRIRVEVCDPAKLCAQELIAITVLNTKNRPPEFHPLDPPSVEENRPLAVAIVVEDPDHDQLTLSASGLPDGATFEDAGGGKGVLRWTPRFDQAGAYQAVVMATDGALHNTLSVKVTVRQKSLAITGHIRDGDLFNPVQGATVTIQALKERPKRVTTDANGFYLAEGFEPAVYEVRPNYQIDEGFVPTARKRVIITFDPTSREVIVSNQDLTGVDFTMYRK